MNNFLHLYKLTLFYDKNEKKTPKDPTLSEKFQNEIVDKCQMDTARPQTHDRLLSWLDTDSSITSGGVKLG